MKHLKHYLTPVGRSKVVFGLGSFTCSRWKNLNHYKKSVFKISQETRATIKKEKMCPLGATFFIAPLLQLSFNLAYDSFIIHIYCVLTFTVLALGGHLKELERYYVPTIV